MDVEASDSNPRSPGEQPICCSQSTSCEYGLGAFTDIETVNGLSPCGKKYYLSLLLMGDSIDHVLKELSEKGFSFLYLPAAYPNFNTSYMEMICEKISFDFIREDFLTTIVDEAVRIVTRSVSPMECRTSEIDSIFITELMNEVRRDPSNDDIISLLGSSSGVYGSTMIKRFIDGKYIFGDHFLMHCYDMSLASLHLKTEKDIPLTPDYCSEFVEILERKYGFKNVEIMDGRSLETDFANYDSQQVLKTLCVAQKSQTRTTEMLEVFGKIFAFLVATRQYGRSTGILPIKHVVFRHEGKSILSADMRNKGYYNVVNDFFFIAHGYYKYYWHAPEFAPGHCYHPLNNRLMRDYLGIRLHKDPGKTLVQKSLDWAISLDAVLFFVLEKYWFPRTDLRFPKWEWEPLDTGMLNGKPMKKFRKPAIERNWKRNKILFSTESWNEDEE
jgi:hypothetical protein